MLFTDFLEELGVRLEAGQRAFCRVAFDGVQVADLQGEDRGWAIKIFGDLPRIPDEEWAFVRAVICIVAGGRSGKTYLCSLRILYLALTLDLEGKLAPGEEAVAIILAPRLKEAQLSLKYIAGQARKNPDIKRLIVADTADQLVLRRPQDGQLVTITPQAAGAGGVSGRGKTLIAVLMDETCFFRDASSGVVNDDAIFDAAEPRVIEGGQTFVSSTPWVARGLLHRKWKENHGHPKTALSAHASTRNMRTNALQLRKVDNAYKKDPRNAAIEFGAEWGSTTVELFFTDAELDSLFDGSAPPLGTLPRPGSTVAAGGDLGFVRNSSSLAIVVQARGVVRLAHLEEHQPPKGQKLRPSVVCKGFAETLARYGCAGLVADQHERASLEEYLSDADLSAYDAPSSVDALVALRAAVREGRVKAPAPLEQTDEEAPADLPGRLREQLAGIRQKRTVGDGLAVVLPTALDGSHCDLAVAFAQAVWGLGAVGGAEVDEEKEEDLWEERHQREVAARERRLRARQERSW